MCGTAKTLPLPSDNRLRPASYSCFPRRVIPVDAQATPPALAQTDGNPMREQLEEKRLFAVMGAISRQGPNAEADKDIALPVPARLDACNAIVKGEQLQRADTVTSFRRALQK